MKPLKYHPSISALILLMTTVAKSLNTPGRDMVDRNRKKGKFKLFNFKKAYIVSVLNVRTIRRKSKQEELLQLFSKNRIQILGIVHHKIIRDDHMEKQNNIHNNIHYQNANNDPIGLLALSQNIMSCNSHLGPENALYTFHDRTNNNRKLLLSYSLEVNLIIANIRFQKK